MRIPIQNIYYVLCYAWGHFPEGQHTDVGAEDSPDLQNLLAKALLSGTNHLLRRGLDRGYIETFEDTKNPRGKIEFSQTIKRSLSRTGQIHCLVDELSPNVLHNQIIVSTINMLRRSIGIDPDIRHK